MRDPTAQLEDVKARWMTGGAGAQACPDEWKDALGDEPELALLALTGQFTRLATRPQMSGKVQTRANLPDLALPTIPHDLRALFRRVLDNKDVDTPPVIALLAKRGVTAHPLDWMPKRSDDDLPEVYGPWQDWLETDAPEGDTHDELTGENWEEWFPQARLAKLREIRKSDPAQGVSLVETIAPNLAAEPRERVIRTLEIALSDGDIAFLETLESDRSGKVRALAAQFMARLGHAKVETDAQSELAAFFQFTKAGMLSRRQVISAVKTKNDAQRKRRNALCQSLSLSSLAAALNVPTDEFIALWEFGEGSDEVIRMVADTGTDTQIKTFLSRALSAKMENLNALIDRLANKDRLDIARETIARDASSFTLTAQTLRPVPGSLDLENITRSGAFRELCKLIRKDDDAVAERALTTGLANLGLIADATAAAGLITYFTDNGVMAADPRLAMLRLNASLKE